MHHSIPPSVCMILLGFTKDRYQKARWNMRLEHAIQMLASF